MQQKQKLPRFSLAQKMILVMTSVLVLISVFLGSTSWKLSSASFAELEQELFERNAENICAQLDNTLEAAQSMMTQIVRNPYLRSVSTQEPPDTESADVCTEEISSIISSLISVSATNSNATISFLNIYMKNGYQYCSDESDFLSYNNFTDCCTYLTTNGLESLDGYVSTIWIDSIVHTSHNVPTRSIVGMRFIYDSISLEKTGILVIGLNERGVRAIYENIAPNAYIVRNDGFLLSSFSLTSLNQIDKTFTDYLSANNSRTGLTSLQNGQSALIHRIPGNQVWLVIPMDQTAVEKGGVSQQFIRQALIFIVFALFIAVCLVWLSAKGLTKSLVHLTALVQRVYEGNIHARFQSKSNDEFSYLGNRINDMLETIEGLFKIQEQNATEKRNLELQLLHSQINPHLLYNTLNSAVWIIRQNDTEKAEKLILSLSSFFKLTLSKGNEMISLADEISMIQHYLDVQNLGRGKSYSLISQVSQELQECKILRLTLQPFVENAVIHGFSDWRDDGTIIISAMCDGNNNLLITINDNGIGILPKDLKELLDDINTYTPAKEHKHYGISNVDRRIKSKFGSGYGVNIESEVGSHTQVTLRLPIRKESS